VAREDDARAFGGWLLIGVDALVYASLVFMTVYLRQGAGEWPDESPVPITLPLVAAAVALAGAAPRSHPALALVAALLVGWTMHRARGDGLSFEGSRFGALFFAFGVFWLVHLAAAAVASLRWRNAWPRRFLAVQGVAGAALMAAVLL
jgi:hypothetical protein